MSRTAFIGPCTGGGSRTDVHVDVSCQPIIHIDICSAHIDISFNPVIHVDVSYQPVVVIDVSCQPIVYVDVSCYPIVNIGPIDVSCQPIVYVDVSCYPIVNLGPIDVSCQPIVNVSTGLTNTNFDAFARLRVSNPYTLFEFNSITGKSPYLIQEATSGGGASTWIAGKSYVSMDVAGPGQSVVRQSREYIMYQPGKSKLVYMTGVLYDISYNTSALTARIGCFDASMGIFIQMQNGAMSVVERNFNNSPADNVIPRASWTDKLDGTGSSGVNIDFSKAQIFYFDYEWLGVGTVRCGIIQSGKYLPYYTFNHANTLKMPYIPMAKLPLRYEISSTGSVNNMHMICGTVISEGGVSPLGQNYYYGNNLTTGVAVKDNDATIRVPIMGIRIRSDAYFNRSTLKLQKIDIISTSTSTAGSWQILRNPVINEARFGSPTWQPFATPGTITAESAVEIKQYASFTNGNPPVASDVTGGTTIYAGYYSQRTLAVISQTIDQLISAYPISTSISGTTSDEFILVANNIVNSGSAPNIFAFIEWMEFI